MPLKKSAYDLAVPLWWFCAKNG